MEAAAIEKIDNLITESQTPAQTPRVFELNRPYFNVAFPVAWPPLGEIMVKHRLRRPRADEEIQYKKKSVHEQRVLPTGKITDERFKVSEARAWLWDQIAEAIQGYPGLEGQADAEGWAQLTPELRQKMRGAHKEMGIRYLFDCEVKVLEDESIMSFSGGQWAVLLRLGPRDSHYASIKLRFEEWDERQKDKFESSSSGGSSEIQGKSKFIASSINQAAYRTLFGATLIGVESDLQAGIHDTITLDGAPFSSLNKDKFAGAMLGEWQVDVMTALIEVWQGK